MKLDLVAIGRLKAGPERQLFDRYAERIALAGRAQGFGALHVSELAESAARREADRRAEEANAMLGVLPAGYKLILLDEKGPSMTSEAFSALLVRWRDSGEPGIAFAIGGADGLGEALRGRAHNLLGFGAATWPHQFVRFMLCEQIYRALTLMAGHPYHRGG